MSNLKHEQILYDLKPTIKTKRYFCERFSAPRLAAPPFSPWAPLARRQLAGGTLVALALDKVAADEH